MKQHNEALNNKALNIDKGVCLHTVDADQDFLLLHKQNPQRYPYLLESLDTGTSRSRFDILFAFPQEIIELSSNNIIKKNNVEMTSTDVLAVFDEAWADSGTDSGTDSGNRHSRVDVPFSGGWFVFLAYELAASIETVLDLPQNSNNNPRAFFARIPAAIIRDHESKTLTLIAEADKEEQINVMLQDLEHIPSSMLPEDKNILKSIEEEPSEKYLDAVKKIKSYITEGDVFQVNLSRLWKGKTQDDISGADIYECLRRHNPAPFAGLITHNDMSVISSSPERLVRVKEGYIETRPIAGTRPRGMNQKSDDELSEELIADPKERAEHIMLIDLERNDLGRVCKPGSVKVNELMVIESYSHVHHIVSNMGGNLKDDVTPGEVIRAVFPGGTITGCPKVRCMEILAELEQAARSAYTGAMGYINLDGSMDLNILIRTMVLTDGELELRAGGGIVTDSEPQRELDETRAKARGMLLALGADV